MGKVQTPSDGTRLCRVGITCRRDLSTAIIYLFWVSIVFDPHCSGETLIGSETRPRGGCAILSQGVLYRAFATKVELLSFQFRKALFLL